MENPVRDRPLLSELSLTSVAVISLFCLLGGGCGQVDPGDLGAAIQLNHDTFKTSIQPILDNRGCSNAGCHFRDKINPNSGGPGGSLRLFDCNEAACTADQHQSNHDSSVGMANLVNPAESRLLSKPLVFSGSGVQHLGGTIFQNASDTDYQTILAWIGNPI